TLSKRSRVTTRSPPPACASVVGPGLPCACAWHPYVELGYRERPSESSRGTVLLGDGCFTAPAAGDRTWRLLLPRLGQFGRGRRRRVRALRRLARRPGQRTTGRRRRKGQDDELPVATGPRPIDPVSEPGKPFLNGQVPARRVEVRRPVNPRGGER